MRFEVLIAVLLKIPLFLGEIFCHLAIVYQHFEATVNLQNTGIYLSTDTVSHPIKLESNLNELTFGFSGNVSKRKGKASSTSPQFQ
jgi:hypothetical protein